MKERQAENREEDKRKTKQERDDARVVRTR